jgi:hypothetical protein
MVDISISQGTASCNANVDLLCRVYGETISCMNEDVYIRIYAPMQGISTHDLDVGISTHRDIKVGNR